jgi:hypothetical protein
MAKRSALQDVLMGSGAVAVVAVVSWAAAPMGPATRTAGTIEQVHLGRSGPSASVRVGPTRVVVPIYPSPGLCGVGGRMQLVRRKGPFGFRYTAFPGSCVKG